jgi:hypothetical protein
VWLRLQYASPCLLRWGLANFLPGTSVCSASPSQAAVIRGGPPHPVFFVCVDVIHFPYLW